MVNSRQVVRAILCGVLLSLFGMAWSPAAYGQQDFVISSTLGFSPPAVDPGISSSALISVQPMNTMSAPSVTLTCTVSPVVASGPLCSPATQTVTAPNTPAVTVTTNGSPQMTY